MRKLIGLSLMFAAVLGFGWWYLIIGWAILEFGCWFDR